jgi:hypothetical protein
MTERLADVLRLALRILRDDLLLRHSTAWQIPLTTGCPADSLPLTPRRGIIPPHRLDADAGRHEIDAACRGRHDRPRRSRCHSAA